MLSKLICLLTIFAFTCLSSALANQDSLVHLIESYFNLGCAWNCDQDYENLNAIASQTSSEVLKDNPLQYLLWMKRAADSSRSGGGGRTKQLRYHLCYFNPISCFKKRADYSKFYNNDAEM